MTSLPVESDARAIRLQTDTQRHPFPGGTSSLAPTGALPPGFLAQIFFAREFWGNSLHPIKGR